MNRARFESFCPGDFYLSVDDVDVLLSYLRRIRMLDSDEVVASALPAGDGNMNCVVRVTTSKRRSFIVKQSRPWVERYPDIAAPHDRIIEEARFYQAVAGTERIAHKMPKLLAFDAAARTIVLQDLGAARDPMDVYRVDGHFDKETIRELCDWLTALHEVEVSSGSFLNTEMRQLNHEHIFTLPLSTSNSLRLDEFTVGLSQAARRLQQNSRYVAKTLHLGEIYLGNAPSPTKSLLHGDFFPGSWLDSDRGLRVIDPEFSFFGPPEFDVGVLLAHLYLSRQSQEIIHTVGRDYVADDRFDWQLADQFAGVEIMRRLIGVAQLPIQASLEVKQALLALSERLVLGS